MEAPQYLPSHVPSQGPPANGPAQLPAPLPAVSPPPVATSPAAPSAYAEQQPAYQPAAAQGEYPAQSQVSAAPAEQYLPQQRECPPTAAPGTSQPVSAVAPVAAAPYSAPQLDSWPNAAPAAFDQATSAQHYQPPVQPEQQAQFQPAPAPQSEYPQTQFQQTQFEQTQFQQTQFEQAQYQPADPAHYQQGVAPSEQAAPVHSQPAQYQPAPLAQNQPEQFQSEQPAQYQPAQPAQYPSAAPVQYQQTAYDPASLQLADQSQPAYQQQGYAQPVPSMEYQLAPPAPTQQPSASQQQALIGSALEFQPLPSPVVFEPEPEYRHLVAADIFHSTSAPASLPDEIAQPVSPALAMARDASLRADLDLDAALQLMLDLGASDLHIAVNATPMIRIDGGLRPLDGAQVWNEQRVADALKSILTPEQLAIYETALEFDFAYTLSSQARFRVNFYQQRDNMGAAFRLIPTGIKSLKELGVPDSIAEFAKLPRGLVLITGPTGSGKSTTLAGLIDIVNRTRADHIMTVEDPIEFLHVNHKSLINQREVGHDTHSFGAALKHVLRQDPDVILVGELRDLETISVALTAAETGHLVFATLHTSDAPQTIDRIIDVYPPHQQSQVRAQLAATLQGVVCQTLIKKASGKGRVVATEVLVRTSAVANLIREGKTFQIHSAMQAGRELGMHTIDQHLADLVSTGQITLEAAKEKSHDLQVLERLVAGSRAPTTNSSADMANSMSYGGQN